MTLVRLTLVHVGLIAVKCGDVLLHIYIYTGILVPLYNGTVLFRTIFIKEKIAAPESFQ